MSRKINRNNRNQNQTGRIEIAGTVGEVTPTGIKVYNKQRGVEINSEGVTPDMLKTLVDILNYGLSTFDNKNVMDTPTLVYVGSFLINLVKDEEQVRKTKEIFENMKCLNQQSRNDITMAKIMFELMVSYKDDYEQQIKMLSEWILDLDKKDAYYCMLYYGTIYVSTIVTMNNMNEKREEMGEDDYNNWNNAVLSLRKFRKFMEEMRDINVPECFGME